MVRNRAAKKEDWTSVEEGGEEEEKKRRRKRRGKKTRVVIPTMALMVSPVALHHSVSGVTWPSATINKM